MVKKPRMIQLYKVAPKCSDCGKPMQEKGETNINVKDGNRLSLQRVELYQCPQCLNTYIVDFNEVEE